MRGQENISRGIIGSESVLLRRERKNKYGSVPGLDDEELADPCELEKRMMMEEWAPVLALPVRGRKDTIRPSVDENSVTYGAFGTVDFDRSIPEFDKARYKAEKLRETLQDLVIMVDIVRDRLPAGRAKYLVLKYLRMGIIELEHIANEDMRTFASLRHRAERLRKEIVELEEASWRRKHRQTAAWIESP